jgi:hypothetical protein
MIAALMLLVIAFLGASLGFSRVPFFACSSQDIFCEQCGTIERTRKVQVLGFKFERTSYRETLLKRRAFAEIAHCKEHQARTVLETFSCFFSFTKGYSSSGFGNYWSQDKRSIWHIGPPTPTSQIWTNQSPAGFCLHEDPAFVGAFERLVKCDPVWSSHQLDGISGVISRKTFPGSLVQFKTNRNVEVIFDHLQKIDLSLADGGDYWTRNETKYPRGGTNEPPPFRPLVTPLRMNLY